jgi:uncharacterized OB-fold protein
MSFRDWYRVDRLPTIYCVGCGNGTVINCALHADETGSAEMAMELAYRLAVSEQPMIRNIRKNVVVLINPVADPDGRDKMADWFYRYLKEGKIMGFRCSGCSTVLFPPQGLCPDCGGHEFNWVPMSGKGKLIYASVGPHRMMGIHQFLQGTVRLEEGPWVSGMLLDESFDFSHPEKIWQYNEADINVVMEVIKNPEGVEAVAFRVVR